MNLGKTVVLVKIFIFMKIFIISIFFVKIFGISKSELELSFGRAVCDGVTSIRVTP